MLVHDIMTAHAEWVAPTITLAEAARKMRDHKIACLPIGHNDRLVGMLTDRDLVCRALAAGADPNTVTAGEVMTKGITWCYEDESVDDILEIMETKQIHHLPVLNRRKRMVGIVTLSDLALRGPDELSSRLSHLASRDSRSHLAAH
jgi:CBS domain-containing protein